MDNNKRIKITEGDIKKMVRCAVNNILSEVRYINPNFRAETSGYLERKFIELITTTLQSNCEKIGENDNVLYFKVTPNGSNITPDDIQRVVKNYFFDRKCTIKQNSDGTLLIGIRNYDTIEPLKDNQTIRVFHGTNLDAAKIIMTYGLSGREQKSRIYNYEYWNNPTGLFVSINFEKAKYFATNFRNSVILEFTTKMTELDAPVWNSETGSYFVQGDTTSGFANKQERDAAKRKANRNAINYPHIENSDNPALANSLTYSYEYQALYYGDLNPNMIKRLWVKLKGEKSFKPYTSKQFIETFCGDNNSDNYKWKLYKPTDDFYGEEDFIRRYNEKWGDIGGGEEFIQSIWQYIGNDGKVPYDKAEALKQFMWPKQLVQFLTPSVYRDSVNLYYPEFSGRINEGKKEKL